MWRETVTSATPGMQDEGGVQGRGAGGVNVGNRSTASTPTPGQEHWTGREQKCGLVGRRQMKGASCLRV